MKIAKLLTICVSALVVSCNGGSGAMDKFMASSAGKTGDVLVVMNDDSYDGYVGDTVFNWLTQPVLVLPQDEASFKVIRIKPTAYNDMLRKTRNIIYCDINPQNEKPSIKVEGDRYASPQILITIKAKDDSAFYNTWLKVEKYIYDTLSFAEKQRYLAYFNKYREANLENELSQSHPYSVYIPKGYNLDVNKPNFVWISNETSISSQALLIFNFPYEGPKSFEKQSLLAKIDSVLMLNVPGPADGSYMAISKYFEPIQEAYMRRGNYVSEMRGLWETKGDFMGGPFVCQSLVDTVNAQMINVFAYAYGGKKDKKLLVWQLESIMSTFEIKNKTIEHAKKD